MKRLLFFYLILSSISVFSQTDSNKYVRVKVLLHETPISTLAELGLEYDHGAIAKGRYWINDISTKELNIIKENGLDYEVLIDDVQAWYIEQNKLLSETSKSKEASPCGIADAAAEYQTPFNYSYGSMGGYLTYQEMLDELDRMRVEFPNLISEKEAIGTYRTQENRPIYWLKIGNNPNIDEDKPEILYNSLTHAREPNSMSQLIFYIWYLLENYETDPEVKYIMDHVELYFIPCVNPDGYIYNELTFPEGGGFWRKNRWLNEDNVAVGVDLNRNYGYDWTLAGASDDQYSELYRGTAPFSEPETQAVANFCEQHDFKIALNCHSFSNLLIFPTAEADTDDNTFDALGKKMTEQNNYGLGTDIETVGYEATGDCSDWMYNEQSTKPKILAMAPEVGPVVHGFWPPASAIEQLNKENLWQNLSAAALLKPYGEVVDKGPDELPSAQGVFYLDVVNIGLEEGTFTIHVQSDQEDLLIDSAPQSYQLSHLVDTAAIFFNYTILESELSAQELRFEVVINNGGIERIIPITKQYYAQPFETVFLDTVELGNPDWLATGLWAATNEDFYSESFSITDSPRRGYDHNETSLVQIARTIDLRDAIAATVQFQAKWELEPRFDFVYFTISINNQNYTPLCGKYTVLDTGNQPAYNAFQRDWVLEKIDLSEYLGEEISFRFELRTDDYVSEDGFYFDDFSVQVIREEALTATSNNSFLDNAVEIRPNPFNDQFSLYFNLKERLSDLKIRLVNSVGQEMGIKKIPYLSAGTHVLPWEPLNFPAGIYFIELEAEEYGMVLKKMIKI